MVNIPRTNDGTFSVKVNDVVKQSDETSIIFLANPNNPTGTMTPEEDIEKLAETGALVVVDEAYIEFVESLNSTVSPALKLVKRHPNVVVMRTLSKWAGLAGLRIGYALAHPTIVSAMMIAKQPYNVNCTAEKAAMKALEMKGGTRQQPWIQRIQGSRWRKAVAAKAAGKGMVEPYANGSKFCPLPGERF